jgi:hypothetical protein
MDGRGQTVADPVTPADRDGPSVHLADPEGSGVALQGPPARP